MEPMIYVKNSGYSVWITEITYIGNYGKVTSQYGIEAENYDEAIKTAVLLTKELARQFEYEIIEYTVKRLWTYSAQ